ncbi:Bacterial transcription activator, effector binding domain [compost metagenome]
MPGRLCAKSILKGAYPELTSVYANLMKWMDHEGYELILPPYEIYITDPNQTKNSENYVTEVYFPIKKKY